MGCAPLQFCDAESARSSAWQMWLVLSCGVFNAMFFPGIRTTMCRHVAAESTLLLFCRLCCDGARGRGLLGRQLDRGGLLQVACRRTKSLNRSSRSEARGVPTCPARCTIVGQANFGAALGAIATVQAIVGMAGNPTFLLVPGARWLPFPSPCPQLVSSQHYPRIHAVPLCHAYNTGRMGQEKTRKRVVCTLQNGRILCLSVSLSPCIPASRETETETEGQRGRGAERQRETGRQGARETERDRCVALSVSLSVYLPA